MSEQNKLREKKPFWVLPKRYLDTKILFSRRNSAWANSLRLEFQLPNDIMVYEDLHLLQ